MLVFLALSYRFGCSSSKLQYRTIRSGDLRLLQEVSRQDIELKSIKFQNYSLLFRRTAYRARVNGVDGVSSCVAIKYSGRDAYAAWERDLLLYSSLHNPTTAHLFGLNRTRPTLLFYDDLIPIVQVWNKSSPIIRCYIEYRLGIDMFYAWSAVDNYLDMEELDDWCDNERFFVQRDTGMICAGSYSPYLHGPATSLHLVTMVPPDSEIISPEALPMELYNDDISALHYLLDPDVDHPKYLDLSATLFHELIANNLKTRRDPVYLAENILPLTFSSILWDEYIGNDRIHSAMICKVAQLGDISDEDRETKITTMFEPGIQLENGWVRYSLDLVYSHLKQPPNFKFKDELFGAGISFDGFSSLAKAWLSQVFFFMDNTKHRGKRGRYGIIDGLYVSLVPKLQAPSLPVINIPGDIYLFIAPPTCNQMADNSLLIDWGYNGKNYYYWSSDPLGSKPMSDRLCDFLGLPKFSGQVTLSLNLWEDNHYEAVRKLQLYEGFNPSTQDYAHAHGLPRLDIISPVEDVVRNYFEDEDLWYDTIEGESDDAHYEGNSPPTSTWGFIIPKHLRPHSGCSVGPWLHGFLSDYDLHSRRGLTSEDGLVFCWKSKPGQQTGPHAAAAGTSNRSWDILCSDGQIVDVSMSMNLQDLPATLSWMALHRYWMDLDNRSKRATMGCIPRIKSR
ncbi:hypothetical protein VKT23_004867 [Stygiomarasmius scandens]|uniref:Uncharacterized protein n=1 Tax=Marasmiellus scandens TaxID=2682957 RepID=A0ABR1JW17_9AGAR